MLVDHIYLHPCLSLKEFHDTTLRQPITYCHHFFPTDSNTFPEDFSIVVYFIPVTFEVYVASEGSPADELLAQFKSSQPFAGGFIESKERFLDILNLMGNAIGDPELHPRKRAKALLSIVGKVRASVNIKLDDRGEDVVWLVEYCPPLPELKREELQPNTFDLIHRRIEWLMHFYIDAMSEITLDSRWRIFTVIRYFTSPSPLTREQESSASIERSDETDDLHKLAEDIVQSYPVVTKEKEKDFLAKLTGSKPLIDNEKIDAVLQNPKEAIEVVGLITAYQFFALPRDRLRISQYFILPQHQRKGLGYAILRALTDVLCADPNIRELSVEDPALAFQRLRDVVSIERAISLGLLSRACLFPLKELKQDDKVNWNDLPTYPSNWPKYSNALKLYLKESPGQRHRIRLLLDIARLIPSEVLRSTNQNQPVQADRARTRLNRGSGEEGTANETAYQWQIANLKDIRVAEKRRLRIESLEWYTSNQKSLADVQRDLEKQWTVLFDALCAAIKAVRKKSL